MHPRLEPRARRSRLLSFLLRLTMGTVVAAFTFRMMGQPRFMRVWLLLASVSFIAGLIFRRMQRPLLAQVLLGAAAPVLVVTAVFWATSWPQVWEPEIAAYQKADRENPPHPGVVVFAGGSSIRKWATLIDDMKPLEVINRGCGGCELSHVDHYAGQIVIPYRPRAVVLYAGDNDLCTPPWKSPQTVLEEFKHFVSIVHGRLPDTWIFYISMKPAPWGDWRLMEQTNRMIAAYARTQQRTQFIDVSSAMLDSKGEPRRELYDWDPMHMNAAGYAVWKSVLRPALLARLTPAR